MTETLVNVNAQSRTSPSASGPRSSLLLKRAFDICLAGAGIVVLSPVMAVLCILIKRSGPGPVFYRGRRMGKDGREFGILKFRTMYECPASYQGPRITARDDDRITPLGHWLRDTKLNELPQLWNVLVGEMSLVGPRPEDPEVAKTWPARLRAEILSVRPGITSPASVIYRDEEKLLKSDSVMDYYLENLLPNKTRLDQLYVRSRRFLTDLDVIFCTLIVLVPLWRKSAVGTETLYNGLLSRFVRRYFSWFVVDNLVAFAALGVAGMLRRLDGPLDLGLGQSIIVGVALAVMFSVVNTILGLGRVFWRHAPPAYAFSLAFSSLISTALIVLLNLWFLPSRHLVPMGMIPTAGLLAWLGFMAVRYRERLLTGLATQWLLLHPAGHRAIAERVLIVGAGECSQLAIWLLRRSHLSQAFSVVGMVDDDPTKQGMMVEHIQVRGLTQRIPELAKRDDVGVILFAIERIAPEEQERLLRLCKETRARVVMVPDLMTMFRERMLPGATQQTAAGKESLGTIVLANLGRMAQ